MRDWRENDASDKDDSQAAVKSVQARKELAAKCDWYRDGAHATQQHRRVQERIQPANTLENVVADHSDEQRNGDESQRNDSAMGQPNDEPAPRDYGLTAPLELWKYAFHVAARARCRFTVCCNCALDGGLVIRCPMYAGLEPPIPVQ
jgi:hypothetical protein